MRKIIKILERIKFKKIKFKTEGKRCNYKFLKSNFSYVNRISLGDNVNIGPGCELDGFGGITIGNGVIFAPEVCIYSRTHNFNSKNLSALPFDNIMLTGEVSIGDYVWVGRRVIILPGVKIGKGAIIGAGAIVSSNIPNFGIAVGNPAKVIKYRDSKKFNELYNEVTPFVYDKYGHKKIFAEK